MARRLASRWRFRTAFTAFALIAALAGFATRGAAGALGMAGLALLVPGVGALLFGRARWAFISSRTTAGAVSALGLVALLGSVVGMPTPAPFPSLAGDGPTGTPPAGASDEAREPTTGLLADADADAAAAIRSAAPSSALAALAVVEVKGRAPRSGYDRDLFGAAWADVDRNGCDTRNDILARDLTDETFKPGTHECVVATGSLTEPYSGGTVLFRRGQDTSDDVQIDHVVALSDAWRKGAQGLDATRRTAFANDPLNLLAVDGSLNQQKSDGDAATWLPPNRAFRCAYVARQVAVKIRYDLWATRAERNAIATVLADCPHQSLPGGVVAEAE